MKFKIGDRVRVPDKYYPPEHVLPEVIYVVEKTFEFDSYTGFYIGLHGVKGMYYYANFELVNEDDPFVLDWIGE